MAESSSARSRLWFYARLALTVVVVAALIHFVSLRDLVDAMRRIPPGALVLCALIVLVGQLFGVVRFQLLLDAYGAVQKPRWLEATRLFLALSFYNTYVPGGVAGDVMRAVALRRAFPEGGLTSSLAVSFVERVTGLAGMLLLVAGVSLIAPVAGVPGLMAFSLLGLLAAVAAILAVMLGRRLAHLLPGRLRPLAQGLPRLRAVTPLWLALLSAVATHLITALGFHVVIRSLNANAALHESLVIVPLACAANYIPATIAGAGTRDAAFVFLYEGVGVPAADALAMSFAVLACMFFNAALGGIANLLGPFEHPVDGEQASAPAPEHTPR